MLTSHETKLYPFIIFPVCVQCEKSGQCFCLFQGQIHRRFDFIPVVDIQWYPGHMAKARRMLAESVKLVDVVIEMVDARAPASTRNPDFDDLFGTKPRVVVLNKADLADPEATRAWIRAYRARGWDAISFSANAGKGVKEAVSLVERAARPVVERMKAKGVNKTVRAMIVGIPNVGKSTFINRLRGSAAAKAGNRPGVTDWTP